MASYRALGAKDSNPLWTPNHFDPLGRRRSPGRGEMVPAVEVVEESTSEGAVVRIVTRNTT